MLSVQFTPLHSHEPIYNPYFGSSVLTPIFGSSMGVAVPSALGVHRMHICLYQRHSRRCDVLSVHTMPRALVSHPLSEGPRYGFAGFGVGLGLALLRKCVEKMIRVDDLECIPVGSVPT